MPEIVELDETGWARLLEIAESALSARPPGVRRQVVLLVRALDSLALIRHGWRLATLDPARRRRFLDSMQRSRLLLVRRGVWGLRSLVFMGYYAHPEIHEQLGYRARPEGWEAVR